MFERLLFGSWVNPSVLGESASPFIDKRDGLTGERAREREREYVYY